MRSIKLVDAREIYAPHGVIHWGKVRAIAASMRKHGWKGRALLVEKLEGTAGRKYRAWTGTHRRMAARLVGIKVPVFTIAREALSLSWLERQGQMGHRFIGGVPWNYFDLARFLSKWGDARAAYYMRLEKKLSWGAYYNRRAG